MTEARTADLPTGTGNKLECDENTHEKTPSKESYKSFKMRHEDDKKESSILIGYSSTAIFSPIFLLKSTSGPLFKTS